MTPQQYLVAIHALGLSQSGAGRFFGYTELAGRRWAAKGPPPGVAKMLAYMLATRTTVETVDAVLAKDRARRAREWLKRFPLELAPAGATSPRSSSPTQPRS